MAGRIRGMQVLVLVLLAMPAALWGFAAACAQAEGDDTIPPGCPTASPRCGDGCIDARLGETCDDGNRLPGDGCSAACVRESGSDADTTPPADDGDTTPPRDDGDTTPPRDDGGTDTGSCPESPCRLRPQCGCPGGEKCTVDFALLPDTVSKICGPAGSTAAGQICAADSDCAAGSVCSVMYSDNTSSTEAMCYEFCTLRTDCTGAGSICLQLGTPTLPGFCSRACNIVTNSGCPTGTSCKPLQITLTGEELTDCTADAGTGTQGSYCSDDTGCRAGYFCADADGDTLSDTCIGFCNLASSTCTGGTTCNAFDTAMIIGSTEYGYCY